MRPSGLLHLYRVRLRARLTQELLAVAGIAVGVALVFVALVANASLDGAVREGNRELVGGARFQLVARGPEGLDESLLGKVRRSDGVADAAAAIAVQANLVGPDGERSVALLGADAGATRMSGESMRRLGTALEAMRVDRARVLALPAAVADDVGVGTGERIRLQVGARDVVVPVVARLERTDYGDFAELPVAVAPLMFAQQAAGLSHRLSRVFVRPVPGREGDVRAALAELVRGRANVWSTDHEVDSFSRAAYPATRSTSVFSIFAALIGFLLAFSAVLLTVPQRRRFIADLRLAGHEPWVAIELLVFDALALGLAGSCVGLLAGDLASRHLFGSTPMFLTFAYPVSDQHIVPWQSVAAAVAAGMVSALLAVLAPLRDVVLHRASHAGRTSDGFGPRRWAVAAGCATWAVATAVAVLAPGAGVLVLFAMVATVLLLLPAVLRGAVAIFTALTRNLRSPLPTLVTLELRSRSTRARALALAATSATAVFSTVAVSGSHADLQRGLDDSASAIDRNGDVWVSFPGTSNAFATTPLHVSPRSLRALRALPGVARVELYRGSFLDVGERRVWVQAPPRSAPTPIAASQLRDGDPVTTTARLRAGGWTVLSTQIADLMGVGVGDRVTLPTPIPTPLRVAAVSTNLGWPPGALVMNADDYARAWGTRVPAALQLRTTAGASPDRVATAVRRALPAGLPALVESQQARIARHYAASRQGLHRLTQVTVVVLIAAVIAMAGAMAGMVWQRRPAIAALKVHGYPEGELWRALLLESALLLMTGGLMGAVFGLYDQIVMTRTLQAITDFPVVYDTAGAAALGILLLVTGVAVAMIALPGWLAVRVRAAPGGTT